MKSLTPKIINTYTAISIPDRLKEEIKEYVFKNGRYTSVGDFVKTAIREKFEKMDRENPVIR